MPRSLKSLVLIASALATTAISAQVPTTLHYQGRLLQNTADQDAVPGAVDIDFSIWTDAVGGVSLWSESWTEVNLDNGIFSVLLGSNGTPLRPADFQGDTSLFLQLIIEGETLEPRQQLGSAPFAMVDSPGNELQDLSVSGPTLSLSGDASSVDLSSFLDNTDSQTLSLAGDRLMISGSQASVDLGQLQAVADLDAEVASLNEDLVRTVFVSSATYSGDLGGFAGADARCQGLADDAGLDGRYRAWLGDRLTDESPNRRFERLGSFRRVDGAVIAEDWRDLTDGDLRHPIQVTELGTTLSSGLVWTHVKPNGEEESTTFSCSSWDSAAGGGTTGELSRSDGGWTSGNFIACTSPSRLYCFEQLVGVAVDQRLSLGSGNELRLTSANGTDTVDLSPYLDNTDGQDLSFDGSTLSLSGGATDVDLSSFAQTISLDENVLSLSGTGSSADLSDLSLPTPSVEEVLGAGNNAGGRELVNVGRLQANDLNCPGCVGEPELTERVFLVAVDCNGDCSDITTSAACLAAGSGLRFINISCVGNALLQPVDFEPCGFSSGNSTCRARQISRRNTSFGLGVFCPDIPGIDAYVTCIGP
ncbi:MAG: hypothetical protein AAGM22_25545 [Acidobacteriota bacterium]